MASLRVRELHHDLCGYLEQIAKHFKSCKITLIVRSPELNDGDVLLSDDNLDEAIAAIRRLQARDIDPDLEASR